MDINRLIIDGYDTNIDVEINSTTYSLFTGINKIK